THLPNTTIYTLSLHDALPIYPFYVPPPARLSQPAYSSRLWRSSPQDGQQRAGRADVHPGDIQARGARGGALARSGRRPCTLSARSEEHTSELQSRENLVCRLL